MLRVKRQTETRTFQGNINKNPKKIQINIQLTPLHFWIDCGGVFELTGENDYLYIVSPNYPNSYPLNIECSYILKVKTLKSSW